MINITIKPNVRKEINVDQPVYMQLYDKAIIDLHEKLDCYILAEKICSGLGDFINDSDAYILNDRCL